MPLKSNDGKRDSLVEFLFMVGAITFLVFVVRWAVAAPMRKRHEERCRWQVCPYRDGTAVEKECQPEETGGHNELETAIVKLEGPDAGIRYSCVPALKPGRGKP